MVKSNIVVIGQWYDLEICGQVAMSCLMVEEVMYGRRLCVENAWSMIEAPERSRMDIAGTYCRHKEEVVRLDLPIFIIISPHPPPHSHLTLSLSTAHSSSGYGIRRGSWALNSRTSIGPNHGETTPSKRIKNAPAIRYLSSPRAGSASNKLLSQPGSFMLNNLHCTKVQVKN